VIVKSSAGVLGAGSFFGSATSVRRLASKMSPGKTHRLHPTERSGAANRTPRRGSHPTAKGFIFMLTKRAGRSFLRETIKMLAAAQVQFVAGDRR